MRSINIQIRWADLERELFIMIDKIKALIVLNKKIRKLTNMKIDQQ